LSFGIQVKANAQSILLNSADYAEICMIFPCKSLAERIWKSCNFSKHLKAVLKKCICYQKEVTTLMQNRPAIVAVGRTKFGEHYGKEPEKLIEEAWLAASQESGLERKALEACYISDCFLPITNKLGLEEGFLSELTELHVPMEVTRSVSAALLTACHAISSGVYSTVLVGGIEKMTDRWDKIRDDLMLLEDPWSYYAGGTPEVNHELMLRAYAKKYGIKGEDLSKLNLALAEVAVKNHAHALKNEYAQFQRRITVEHVLSARAQSQKPLGLYDFAPISDGASAVILTNQTTAKKLTSKPVYVLGCASATDFLNFPGRADLTHFVATRIAIANALKMAGINLWDIQIAELYDQSTVMEMVTMEDLGFCEEGTAWQCIRGKCESYDGFYEVNGKKLSVNTNGGLKADGNPLGATGGAQVFEVFRQLRDEAGERQVKTAGEAPKYGCTQEFEGFGTKGYVTILGRD
jgi:acetyl-CoA C-acetyltransferase